MNPENLFVSFAIRGHLHSHDVNYISWECGDGKFMTAGDSVVCTWDADTGKLLETLEVIQEDGLVSDNGFGNIVWETSGRRMLIGNEICDSKTGAVLQTIENDGHRYTWEHSGDRIATASDEVIFIWDSCTGQLLRKIDAPGYKSRICWAGGGNRIAVIGHNLQVWDAATGMLLHEFISDNELRVRYVSCQPGGHRIASTGMAGIQIHDGISGELQKTFPGYFQNIQWEPDGNRISVLDDGGVHLIDADLGLVWENGWCDSVCDVGWEGTGRRITVWDNRHGYLRIWNTRTDVRKDKELYVLSMKSKSCVKFLSWQPGGSRLFSVVTRGGVGLWNTDTAEWLADENRYRFEGVPCWSIDCFITYDKYSDKVLFTKITSGEVVSEFKIDLSRHLSVKFLDQSARRSPDSTMLFMIFGEGSLIVVNVVSGELLQTIAAHSGPITVYGWNNTSSRVAVAGEDGSVSLREIPSGDLLHVLQRGISQVTALSWEVEGDRIAVGTDVGEIEVWNARSGELVAQLSGHTGPVNAISWLLNPPRIASAGDDGRLLIYDSESLTRLQTLDAGSGALFSVSWESGGRRIASGGEDNTIRIWRRHGEDDNSSFQIRVELVASYGSAIARTPSGYATYIGDPSEMRLVEKHKQIGELRRTTWHEPGDLGKVICNPDRFQAALDGRLTRADLIEDIAAAQKIANAAKLAENLRRETPLNPESNRETSDPERKLSIWNRLLQRFR